MKQYHYVVIVPVDDDGTIGDPYLDASATLPSIDEPVWNDSEDDWERQDDAISTKIEARLLDLLHT